MSNATKLAGVAAAATLASTALAAPELAQGATTIQEGRVQGANSEIEFAQFNAAQGTLNSVTVVYLPHSNTHYSNPNQTSGLAEFNVQAKWTITSNDANAPVLPGWEKTQTSLQNHMNSQYFFNVSDTYQTTVLTSGLSGFVGSGVLNYNVNSVVNILSSNVPYGSPLSNSSNGGIGLIYDFTEAVVNPPSAVPEPGTWAMMITGFGLAGAALRRHRQAANANGPTLEA